MHVALNDESEYAGGRLVFATAAGFEMPPRPAGTACTHTFEVVHGVSAMASGVRYSLFLCNTKGDASAAPAATCLEEVDTLQYLVAPTLAQFKYFEAALSMLRSTSDDLLAAGVGEYVCFLAAHVRRDAGQQGLPGCPAGSAAELAWRVHKLRPIAYLAACQRLESSPLLGDPQEVLGMDLVAAMRRQESFMSSILAQRALLETHSAVEAAVGDYCFFLSAMRHADALEPSTLVDLVWHTHQQMPDRYHEDCVRIAGRLLDHDDTPARMPAVMEAAAEILKCPAALPIKPEMHGRARVRGCDDGKISTGRLTWARSEHIHLRVRQQVDARVYVLLPARRARAARHADRCPRARVHRAPRRGSRTRCAWPRVRGGASWRKPGASAADGLRAWLPAGWHQVVRQDEEEDPAADA